VPWPYWADDYPIEPYPIEDIGEPGWTDRSPAGPPEGPPGLSSGARASLSRLGLLRGNWPRRLATAGPELSRFINRFHEMAGARHVIEEYFAGRYQRAVALMAIRLSERLAARDPDFRRGLHFDRRISFAPDGQPILTVVVGYRGLHYRLFPWRRLNRSALERQLQRDRLVFGSPARVRWMFDRRLMPVSKNRMAADLRQMLGDRAVPNQLVGLL
jgi:hypothetical protein